MVPDEFEDGTAAFFTNREPAWHSLGVVTPNALTAEDALKTAETKNPETVDYHIKNLHKFYLKQHLKYDKAAKQADEIKDTVYKTKNLLGLFKKYEQRINSAGRKLKKNYMRLYSIEK